MSPEVLAAILGVLGGVIIERAARSWGRLWCEPSAGWYVRFSAPDDLGNDRALPPGQEDRAESAEYSLSLDLFNGKEIPVGLRDVTVVIHCAPGELVSKPWDANTGKLVFGRTTFAPIIIVNLPPRQWIHLELLGSYRDREEVRRLARWYWVEFVGQRQRRGPLEPKTFRKTIASRLPLPDPWQSRSYI